MNARALAVTAAISARRALADRGGLVVATAFYLVVVSVLASLWRWAAEASDGGVAGYTAVALTWYIATSEAATMSISMRLIEEIGDDVASGSVAAELLRPASVVWVRVASVLGRSLPRLVACGAGGAALSLAVVGPPPDPWAALLAVPSLVLAVACNVIAQHAFAAAAFWVRDARSTWFLYQKLVFIVGGMLLPLEVMPDGLETVARALPFMAMAYAPARLASGHLEPGLLAVQLAWLAVLGVVATAVFAAGERRLQAVGG
ncbi:MAG TPA: ABC-2 family transporter protein [Acidimicrobiales bacterium]